MGSFERPKKSLLPWKKAILHFSFCFALGFFTGFTPANNKSLGHGTKNFQANKIMVTNQNSFGTQNVRTELGFFNRSLREETETAASGSESRRFVPRQLIIVTPTRPRHPSQEAYLRKLGNTLKLVSHPLLWIVIEPQTNSIETVKILRQTGVLYRHIVCKENFTNTEELMEHQRNLALKHIELHRLDGIVHFADEFDVYDLQFFEEIREIEVFGTWSVSFVHESKKVHLAKSLCDESQVLRWNKDMDADMDTTSDMDYNPNGFGIKNSAIVFSSTILWDPERWGRPSTTHGSPQQSLMDLIQRLSFEDGTKVRGLEAKGYRKPMLWRRIQH